MVGFNKKTVKDVNLAGKRVLLRVDYNVADVENDFRIQRSVPTIEYILKQKPAGLMIISHRGRPTNAFDKQHTLKPIAEHLSKLLERRVPFVHECIGDEAKEMAAALRPGGVLMLENLRFHAEEEKNDADFAKSLVAATAAEVFVQDGFGVVHRAHASTDAITRFLPAVAGLLLEQEATTIHKVMHDPKRPLLAVVGGAKIADKIELLERLIDLADAVALGGAMANNFLKIQGQTISRSLYDKADLDVAHDVLDRAIAKAKKQSFSFLLPIDAVVSKSMDGRASTRVVDLEHHALSDIQAYPKLPKPSAYTVGKDEAIYDIGPASAARIAGLVELANTVIWNGTVGAAEVKGIGGAHPPFAHGSRMVAEAIIGPANTLPSKPFSLAAGGDTAAYLEAEGLIEDFNHVSTGGGATLELMAGHKLPGIEALQDK